MEIKRYSISDLKERISENTNRVKSASKKSVRESKSEFEPVYGKNVPSDNKKINDEAYKTIKKETEAYDGGLGKGRKKEVEAVTTANNKGMSDIQYDSISKPFKDKVKAQLKGYTSADAEKNHKNDDFGNAYYGDDASIKSIADHAKELKKEKDGAKTDGLVSSKHKDEIEKENETMFESTNKISKIVFKHTQFLSEGHMLTKVPDEYKVEGKRFIMKDTADNEYLVEWTDSKPNITKKMNKTQINEEMNRIKELYNYKSKEVFKNSTPQTRVNENKNFTDMLNRSRQLMK